MTAICAFRSAGIGREADIADRGRVHSQLGGFQTSHTAFRRDERMSPGRWYEGVDHAIAEGERGAINGIVN
jgi:hypothetical protein